MSEKDNILKDIGSAEYKHGFETQVEQEFIPKGRASRSGSSNSA